MTTHDLLVTTGWPVYSDPLGCYCNYDACFCPQMRPEVHAIGWQAGQPQSEDGPSYASGPRSGNHLGYWYWGARHYTGDSLIVLGDNRETLESKFEEVQAVGQAGHPLAMQQEHFTVFLCRRPKVFESLQEAWPSLKNFN